MKRKQISTYTAPTVEVMQMEVESGIAISATEIYLNGIYAGEVFDEIIYDDEL